MYRKRTGCLLIFSFIMATYMQAQENFFGDVVVAKNLSKSEKWGHSINGHFKHFFNEEGWYRFGTSYTATQNLGNWGLQGGLVVESTFDKDIENYWEIRPWAGVMLSNTISDKLKFQQFFKFEWRNLLFAEDTENKITTRTRFKIMPVYDLGSDWSLFTSYEWYILPNKDLGARFVNSREWNVGFTKSLKSFSININYTRERFNSVLSPESVNANTLAATFIF